MVVQVGKTIWPDQIGSVHGKMISAILVNANLLIFVAVVDVVEFFCLFFFAVLFVSLI